MDLKKLATPFAPEDIEWRVQQAGGYDKKPWAMVLAYVTNRAIMQRLDDVCGVGGWRNEYDKAPDGGIMCGISILVDREGKVVAKMAGEPIRSDEKEWVTKWDGAENTQVEAVKGGLSGAMKRSAVQWGIGRYLYKLEANFVTLVPVKPEDMKGWSHHWDKENKKRWYWKIPTLPAWAQPVEEAKDANAQTAQ